LTNVLPIQGEVEDAGFFDRKRIRGTGISRSSNANAALSHKDLRDCGFRGCIFQNASFQGSRFLDCTFELCDLSMVNLCNSTFKRCVFKNCKRVGIALSSTNALESLTFDDCNLRSSSLYELDLRPLKVMGLGGIKPIVH